MNGEKIKSFRALLVKNANTFLILVISFAAFVGSLIIEFQYFGIIAPCIWCTALRWIAFINGSLALADIYLRYDSRIPFIIGIIPSITGLGISAFNMNLQVIGVCLFNCVSVPVLGIDLFVWALGVMGSTLGLQLITLFKRKQASFT